MCVHVWLNVGMISAVSHTKVPIVGENSAPYCMKRDESLSWKDPPPIAHILLFSPAW